LGRKGGVWRGKEDHPEGPLKNLEII